MAIERRRVTTASGVWQRFFPPSINTTNATPTAIYTSSVSLPEGRFLILKSTIGVFTTTTAVKASSIELQAIVARATGGSIRLAATNFSREDGEYTNSDARAAITVNTGDNTFSIVVTGKTGLNLTWLCLGEAFRNA